MPFPKVESHEETLFHPVKQPSVAQHGPKAVARARGVLNLPFAAAANAASASGEMQPPLG